MKFEFGDLYKFIVSLGMFLVSSAFVVPWLFLKEKFDFPLVSDVLCKNAELSCKIINIKKTLVYYILSLTPWISTIFFLTGGIVIVYGIRKWKANQLLLDEQAKIEFDIKKASFRSSTDDEIIIKQEQEIIEFESKDLSRSSYFEGVKAYTYIEKKVQEKLASSYGEYEIERNMRLADTSIDYIIKRKRLQKDFLIELKYIRKGFNYGWLKESFLRNIYKRNMYKQFRDKKAISLLLVLVDDDVFDEVKYSKLSERLVNNNTSANVDDHVCIYSVGEFMRMSKLDLDKYIFKSDF
ncbi:hypothetical protein [Klebsiella pneumoniae]